MSHVHPCARCATVQQTCCQQADVLVTGGDLNRIAGVVGRTDFWERRAPAHHSYLEPDPDDPNWLTLTTAADGTRRMLRRLDGGRGHFLGGRGCSLPADVRPLVCRLYPYRHSERGVTGEEDEYCPRRFSRPPGSRW